MYENPGGGGHGLSAPRCRRPCVLSMFIKFGIKLGYDELAISASRFKLCFTVDVLH